MRSCLARRRRWVCQYSMGETPNSSWKTRRIWRSVTPSPGGELLERIFGEKILVDVGGSGAGELAADFHGAAAGRELGAAALAGAVAGDFGLGFVGEEGAVFAHGRLDAADGAAVDAGGFDGDEEAAVEAGIAGEDGLVTLVGVEDHVRKLLRKAGVCSPFSDIEFLEGNKAVSHRGLKRAEEKGRLREEISHGGHGCGATESRGQLRSQRGSGNEGGKGKSRSTGRHVWRRPFEEPPPPYGDGFGRRTIQLRRLGESRTLCLCGFALNLRLL